MPRTPKQNEAMRQATKEKIQTAAIKLFTQKGFAATSVQDIASSADISTGLMYRHYKTKEDLYSSIVLEAAEELGEIIMLLQSDTSPKQLIQEFTEEILSDLTKDDEFARYMVLITQAFFSEDFLPEVKVLLRQNKLLIDQMACLIEKGQKLGEFKYGDPHAMAQYYFSTIQGLSETRFILKERFIAPTSEIMNAFLMKEGS